MLKLADAIDVDGIVSFEADVMDRRLYGQPLDHAGALAEVRANQYFLDFRQERIVATGAWRRRDDGTAYLSNIAGRPELRRRGLARAMMLHLLSCCGDAASIDLSVHPDNEAARALYASLGFNASKQVENFFGDGEPRLIMVRSKNGE
jgi:ribosomal protein S18 acetylase RimI-like enzyme